MRGLLGFELHKIWHRRWALLPLCLLGIVILWLAVSGFRPLTVVLNGTVKMVNEETRAFWGQTATDELKDYARKRFLELGGEETSMWGQPAYSVENLTLQGNIRNRDLAVPWMNILSNGTQEQIESNRNEELMIAEERLSTGEMTQAKYQELTRAKNPAVWVVAPSYSAWGYFLKTMGYSHLLAGIFTLGLIIVFLSGIVSNEYAGSMMDVSLSKPKRNLWLWSKMLASALTGAGIAGSLSVGLLLTYGILYGFQGWNLSALPCVVNIGGYGMLLRSVNCLQLAAMQIIFWTLGGAFFGVLMAFFSSMTRKALPAAGLFIFSLILMESIMIFEAHCFSGLKGLVLQGSLDLDLLDVFTMTPARIFFNTDTLFITTGDVQLLSVYDGIKVYNNFIVPEFALIFAGLMLVSMAAASWASRRIIINH